jgi:hypothetical protein
LLGLLYEYSYFTFVIPTSVSYGPTAFWTLFKLQHICYFIFMIKLHVSGRIYFCIGGNFSPILNLTERSTVWGYLFLTDPTKWISSILSPEGGNRSSIQNAVFVSVLYNTVRWLKTKNPVISSVIHHRQNPLESTLLLIVVSKLDEEQGDWTMMKKLSLGKLLTVKVFFPLRHGKCLLN